MALVDIKLGEVAVQSKQKIIVNRDGLDEDALKILQSHQLEAVFVPAYIAEDELIASINESQAVAMILSQAKITKKVLASIPTMKVIVKHGSGVNNVNLQAAETFGVPIYRAIGANAQAVAEHAIAMLFALRKSLVVLDNATKKGEWLKGKFSTADIEGAILGLIGLGEIGHRVAKMANAMGMRVIAFDPVAAAETAAKANIHLVDSPQAVAEQADVISLHCPLTPKTKHLVNAEFLAKMKPHAGIINTARGGIIDEDALAQALVSKNIAGAALDSFASEPPEMNSALWQAPNLITTPHIAGQTPGAVRAMGVGAAQIIVDFLAGKDIEAKFKAEYAVLGGLQE